MTCKTVNLRLLLLVLLVSAPCVHGICQSRAGRKAGLATADVQVLHAQALGVVQEEDARAKQPFCEKALTTLDINQCYFAELGKINASYLKLARLLGALLRAGYEPGEKPEVKRISFDDAESAWASYRDKECNAAGSVYEGGTIRPSVELGCKITLTHSHMDELWSLYDDLGTL